MVSEASQWWFNTTDPVKPQIDFVEEAHKILAEAAKQGVVLRAMGATAIRIHCSRSADLIERLKRDITDIDFVGYDKQTSKINKLFESLGYVAHQMSYSFSIAGRLIFYHPSDMRHIDVFLDRLAMCHTVEYAKRLELETLTVPLAEIVLQKMQIVQISEKDIKDMIVILTEHDIGDTDNEAINIAYIAKLLGSDWGFYYTVTTNLAKVKSLIKNFPVVTEEEGRIVTQRIDRMLERIENEPKTSGWKMRAKVGTKKKWYKDVWTPSK